MQKRKYKKFGAVILIVAMIVTMFSTVSASADEGGTAEDQSSTKSAIYECTGWYLRSPHTISYIDQYETQHNAIAPALFGLKLQGSDSVAASVYCCDLITDAPDEEDNITYVRTNLEDALYDDSFDNSGYNAYYTREKASQIRYILKYGFHADFSDTELRNLAKAADINEETEGKLTKGEALNATQCAIWSLANPKNLKNIYYSTWNLDSSRIESTELDDEIQGHVDGTKYPDVNNRIQKVYKYLVDNCSTGYNNPSVIAQFTDENTVLTLKKLTEEGEAVYDVTVSFKLKGTFTDKGDLKLTASLGKHSQTWQLLKGEGDKLTADKDGMYTITFEDVPADSLGNNPEIKLVLDGSQEIQTGFYFYEPINPQTGKVDRSTAQSFVGTGAGSTPIHRETTIGFQLGTKTVKIKKCDGSAQALKDVESPTPEQVDELKLGLKGVEFALYVQYGDLTKPVPLGLANKITDENGEITWEGLAEAKNADGTDAIKYYVKEVSTPAGYIKNDELIEVGQAEDSTPILVKNCHDLGSLTIRKTTENFSDESPNKDRHYEFLVELDYNQAYLKSNNHEWTSTEALEEQYAVLIADYENSCEEAAQLSVEEDPENPETPAEVKHPELVRLEKDKTTGKMTAKVLLKAGESITLSGIPAGAEYTVTELNANRKPMGDNVMNEFDGELIATPDASRTGIIKEVKEGVAVTDLSKEEFVNVRFDEGVLDMDTDAQFSIDIHKTLDGRPSTKAFSFTLTDVTPGDSKLPTQTVYNETEGDETGNVVFAPIKFKEAGTYTFEIREVLEKGYICDDNVYTVVVKVDRNDDMKCLEVADVKYYSQDKKAEDIAALEKAAEDAAKETGSEPAEIELTGEEGLLEEGESIVFKNTTITYGNYTSVGVKKVWELNGKGTASDSVTVNLLKNGKVDKTVVLNQGNNWSYTWNLLDDSYTWTVSEADVPEGFTSNITKDGLTFTITNTYVEEEKTDEEEGGGGNGGNGNGGGNSGNDKNPNRLPPDWNVLDETPKTGDAGADALVLNILLLSISALAGTILYLRRKKTNR